LAKTVSGGALVSFLRQHYTSSATSAGAVAAYVQAAGPAPRGERQKDQGKQPAQPTDRAKLARPDAAAPAPASGRPSAAIPSAAQPPAAAQPATGAQPTGPKQRERLARPANPAADQGGVDQRGRPLRKSRRALRGEPVPPAAQQQATTPAAEPAATPAQSAPEAAPTATVAPRESGPTGARPAAAARPPGFSEPLP
jgi:hypothetical protein